MGRTWQSSVRTAEPVSAPPVEALPDYGWNSERGSSSAAQESSSTPFLDAAAQETGGAHASPAPLDA
ncbi:MAG: hypothetical protein ABMB14_12710, partial [Myxococcota bacterium]